SNARRFEHLSHVNNRLRREVVDHIQRFLHAHLIYGLAPVHPEFFGNTWQTRRELFQCTALERLTVEGVCDGHLRDAQTLTDYASRTIDVAVYRYAVHHFTQ